MIEQKKKWEKPLLIVLERNKPEEAVLLYCKMGNAQGPPGATGHLHCRHGPLGPHFPCEIESIT